MCLEPTAYTLSEKDQHYFSELSLNNNTVTIHLMGFINQSENHCPRETERKKYGMLRCHTADGLFLYLIGHL